MSPTRPDLDEVLRLYDREQREHVVYPGTRREDTPPVVRHVSRTGDRGTVIFARLDEATADAAIDAQIGYFESIGQGFEWKLYDHDAPGDLRSRLEARGFEVEEAETIMVLDLEAAARMAVERVAIDVRPIDGAAGMDDLVALLEQVWGPGQASTGRRLAMEAREYPGYLSIYGSYEGGLSRASRGPTFTKGADSRRSGAARRGPSAGGGATTRRCSRPGPTRPADGGRVSSPSTPAR